MKFRKMREETDITPVPEAGNFEDPDGSFLPDMKFTTYV